LPPPTPRYDNTRTHFSLAIAFCQQKKNRKKI
jgi:hypothetical protein